MCIKSLKTCIYSVALSQKIQKTWQKRAREAGVNTVKRRYQQKHKQERIKHKKNTNKETVKKGSKRRTEKEKVEQQKHMTKEKKK